VEAASLANAACCYTACTQLSIGALCSQGCDLAPTQCIHQRKNAQVIVAHSAASRELLPCVYGLTQRLANALEFVCAIWHEEPMPLLVGCTSTEHRGLLACCDNGCFSGTQAVGLALAKEQTADAAQPPRLMRCITYPSAALLPAY
jgi:hypothetical protein